MTGVVYSAAGRRWGGTMSEWFVSPATLRRSRERFSRAGVAQPAGRKAAHRRALPPLGHALLGGAARGTPEPRRMVCVPHDAS
jgi:hypothetical protein